MRRKEIREGWEVQRWPKPFVRRGMVGSFRDEMPAAALSYFLQEAGPTLAAHGYA
jgi:hypothetical protein